MWWSTTSFLKHKSGEQQRRKRSLETPQMFRTTLNVCVSLQRERETGLMDVHSGLRRDDVTGCGARLSRFIGRIESQLTALKKSDQSSLFLGVYVY